MSSNEIRVALAQVSELQQLIIGNQQFRGYSGRSRILSGLLAVVTASVIHSAWFPADPESHVAAWAVLCASAVFLNAGALLYWFCNDPDVARDLKRLRPLVDVLPGLIVGAAITAALVANDHFGYLFGIWMSLFGIANLASRNLLPAGIGAIGYFYILCGIACLFNPALTFDNPWPMAIVFFVGEVTAGSILHIDKTRRLKGVRYAEENR